MSKDTMMYHLNILHDVGFVKDHEFYRIRHRIQGPKEGKRLMEVFRRERDKEEKK